MLYISGMMVQQFIHTTSHHILSYKGPFLVLYNKSIIDIWNSNSNINVGNFDHVSVE